MPGNDTFIDDWNNVIEFKIKDTDLVRPNKQFLFNALSSYLKHIHIDHKFEDQRTLTNDIKFCQYINHLYKISDSTNSFLYFDFMHPSPKKTVHLLKILLNYYLYFSMTKAKILDISNDLAKEYDLVKATRNQLQVNIEESKISAEAANKKFQQFIKLLPELKKKEDAVEAHLQTITQQISHKTDTLKNLETKSYELDAEVLKLKSEIVHENEVDHLLEMDSKLKNQSEDLDHSQHTLHSANQELVVRSKKVESFIENIEHIFELYTIENLTTSKTLQQILNENERKIATCNKTVCEKEICLKQAEKQLAEYKEQIMEQKLKLSELISDEKLKQLKREETLLAQSLEETTTKVMDYEEKYQELENLSNFINNHGTQIIEMALGHLY